MVNEWVTLPFLTNYSQPQLQQHNISIEWGNNFSATEGIILIILPQCVSNHKTSSWNASPATQRTLTTNFCKRTQSREQREDSWWAGLQDKRYCQMQLPWYEAVFGLETPFVSGILSLQYISTFTCVSHCSLSKWQRFICMHIFTDFVLGSFFLQRTFFNSLFHGN